jgi:septum formation protein
MLILASKSPRRQELLRLITNDFTVKSAEVDEALPEGIGPKEAVEYLSEIKAMPFKNNDDIVIGADTVVCIGNKILGKPQDIDDAHRMLSLLSGKVHSVFTGVTVFKGNKKTTFSVETKVKFFPLTKNEINDYISTKEPMDKAGAYGIQGKGALLVEKIEGDYFNVVGLPVSKLHRVLSDI